MNKLNRPPPGSGSKVTEQEVAADGESFMAFAAAFGVAPPAPAALSPADPENTA